MTIPLSWTNPNLDYEKYKFVFNFKNKNKSLVDSITAARNNVEYICQNYNPPYTLCLSGGVDSQAMLYSWIISGKKFNTFTAVYNFNLNWHDIKFIKTFSDQFNVQINFVQFDLINFLENEHDNYAKTYYCGSPHFTTYMKFADLIDEGTTIYSGEFIRPRHRKFLSRNELGLFHYSLLSKKSVVPFFFIETEELAYSFKHKEKSFDKDGYKDKVEWYRDAGFPVITQESKYNGFEEIKNYYEKNCKKEFTKRELLIRTAGQKSNKKFDLLFRNKYEAMFAHHKYLYVQ